MIATQLSMTVTLTVINFSQHSGALVHGSFKSLGLRPLQMTTGPALKWPLMRVTDLRHPPFRFYQHRNISFSITPYYCNNQIKKILTFLALATTH